MTYAVAVKITRSTVDNVVFIYVMEEKLVQRHSSGDESYCHLRE